MESATHATGHYSYSSLPNASAGHIHDALLADWTIVNFVRLAYYFVSLFNDIPLSAGFPLDDASFESFSLDDASFESFSLDDASFESF